MFTSYGKPRVAIAPHPVSTVIQKRQRWRHIVYSLMKRKHRVVIEDLPLQRTIDDEIPVIHNEPAIPINVVRNFFCTVDIDQWGPFIALPRFGPLSMTCTRIADVVDNSRYFPRDHWMFFILWKLVN